MLDSVSRTQPRLDNLITTRKVGRPTRDRAPVPQEVTGPKPNDEKDLDSDLLFYGEGNGGAHIYRYVSKGQYLNTYA